MARDREINIPASQVRPSPTVDGLGNPIADGPDTKVADCLVGVFPVSLRRDPYRLVGGSETNLRRWWVAVRRAPTIQEGDAIVVPEGVSAGTYRVQQVDRIKGEAVILALTLKQ